VGDALVGDEMKEHRATRIADGSYVSNLAMDAVMAILLWALMRLLEWGLLVGFTSSPAYGNCSIALFGWHSTGNVHDWGLESPKIW
jgi:hypothetical protein